MKEKIGRIAAGIGRPSRLFSRKNWILTMICAAAGMSVFLIWTTAPKPAAHQTEEESWPVTTLTANPGPVSPQLTLYGRVETPRAAMVTAAVHALVRSVPVMEGQMASKGEVLVILDDTDIQLAADRRQADVQEAEASLESMKLQNVADLEILKHEKELYELKQEKVERYRKLLASNHISEENMNSILREAHSQAISLQARFGKVRDYGNSLARSRARLKKAHAALREAQAQLERTVVRAPFRGRITRVFPAPGEWVGTGVNLVEMYDTDALEIRAQIPLRVASKLQHHLERSDGPLLTAAAAIGGDRLECRLDRLSGKIGTGQSGIDGLFLIPGGHEELVLGRVVKLTLDLPWEADGVAVPIQSIYGEDRIYRVLDGRLQGLNIERLGEATDESGQFSVLVRSPELGRGDQIVTTQLSNAMGGLKVSVSNDQPPSAEPSKAEDSRS